MRKIKQWIAKTGFTNILYLLLSAFTFIFMGNYFLTGAFIGVFVYINWNTIIKLIKDEKETQ